MSDQTAALGGRLPLADPAALNPAQRAIFDRMATRIVPWANDAQFQSTADDGRLIGPFNPALLNPAIAAPFLDLQFAEQSAHIIERAGPRSRHPRRGRRLAGRL